MSLNSLLPGIRRLGELLGNISGTNRDYYTIFGYPKALSYTHLESMYMREGIAGRIVEAEPRATWTNPPELKAYNEEDVSRPKELPTEFTTAWNTLCTKFNLYEVITRADKLAGISPYAVLLLGFGDTDDLTQPLNTQSTPELLYIQPYAAEHATIDKLVTDTTNPRYSLPEIYSLKQMDTSGALTGLMGKLNSGKSLKVHASRIVHIAENTMSNDLIGNPRLSRAFNLLTDIMKVTGGSSEMFWLTANRGLHIDVDKDMALSQEDAENLTDEVEQYVDGLSRIIRTRGVKVDTLGGSSVDPRGTFGILVAQLSATSGIPQRILVGSEAGQLASAQDRANWATRIEERRELFAEPIILNPLVTKFIEIGLLPDPNALIVYDWPDAFIQNPLERAQTAAQRGRTVSALQKSYEEPVITIEESRRIIEEA